MAYYNEWSGYAPTYQPPQYVDRRYQTPQYTDRRYQPMENPVIQPNPQNQPQMMASQPSPPVQIQQDERIWVQNEMGAVAYLVAPNSFVRLWDSSKPTFYEKRADNEGRIMMEIFDYSKRTGEQAAQDQSNMISKDEYLKTIDQMEQKINALSGQLSGSLNTVAGFEARIKDLERLKEEIGG